MEGDILDQDVDVIVNAWNRNVIPWWLMLPRGVFGAIKRRGGTAPFKELRNHGAISLGDAVLTSAGRLPFMGIIHVAANRTYWGASEWSLRQSVKTAMALAEKEGFKSIAFPPIEAGSIDFHPERASEIIEDELLKIDSPLEVRIVVRPKSKKQTPWWLVGFQLIFMCLVLAQTPWKPGDYSGNAFMVACVIGVLVIFVYQFIKQQAQYTIKTMMIATFVVAIFCSIYKCFGFNTVFRLFMIAYLIAMFYAATWESKGEKKR